MKFILQIAFLSALLLFIKNVSAQQDTIVVSSVSFDPSTSTYFLSQTNGWYFKQGTNTNWASNDISMAGWKKMQPIDFQSNLADKNRKLEGWFRIKIKFDSSTSILPSGILSQSWVAADIYINGKYITSFGQTGTINHRSYIESRPFLSHFFPVQFAAGQVYSVAVHVVDYVVPFSGGYSKSYITMGDMLMLTTPYTPSAYQQMFGQTIYFSILLAITGIISLLFWTYWILNRKESNFLLFALCCSCLAGSVFISFIQGVTAGISFTEMLLYSFLSSVSLALIQLFIFHIIIKVLNYKASVLLKFFIYALVVAALITYQLPSLFFITSLFIAAYAIVCLFIAFKKRKNFTDAQRVVVAGLLIAITCKALAFYTGDFLQINVIWINIIFNGIGICAFPFSLMIYASVRFMETIHEVKLNADKVVQLSEEKKEQAILQQTILQEEVDRQTLDLRETLSDLKSTQSQLIQSEKMASLGELTAGIAHEIQNPLNFVNNFSEVSSELISEMVDEVNKGNYEEVKAIAEDVKQNLDKINHHGKRAGDIVKGMLQHSRSSSGVKEPTNINTLADEYLRLAYHGLRAKDKSFNATMKTDFDETISNINIIPQDIGRVILNLITNAFYVVTEKKKNSDDEYEPTVTVSTSRSPLLGRGVGGEVSISVKDNGNGIPQKVLDKIFQPFFTTKPTGKGTGLGLSLSYDIVKAHGGEIKVNTKEYEGTEFTIILPA